MPASHLMLHMLGAAPGADANRADRTISADQRKLLDPLQVGGLVIREPVVAPWLWEGVFDLLQPKDCTDATISCDCTGTAVNADGPPLCDATTPTTQVRGKAYPTIRELRVAKGLGNQGVVASICPRVNAASYFEVLFSRIRGSVPASSN